MKYQHLERCWYFNLYFFQKSNVFINRRSAQITNSCQFADVEVSALVGGVVPEKSRRKAICGRPICFPFALAIATPDRNSLWTWFVGRDWDSNPISTPYATTAKPHHLSQNPPTFSVYIPVFPIPFLCIFRISDTISAGALPHATRKQDNPHAQSLFFAEEVHNMY